MRTFSRQRFPFWRRRVLAYPIREEWPVEVGLLCWRLSGVVRLFALPDAGSFHLILPDQRTRIRKVAKELMQPYMEAHNANDELEFAQFLRKNGAGR